MDGSVLEASPLSATRNRPLRIIVNPTAGQARGARLKRSLDRLTAAGTQWDIVETQARGDAEALARALAEAGEVGAIIAAGGDGTINEAINGVMAAQRHGAPVPPFGLLPLGTANVLAGELGIDTPETAAAALLSGQTRKIALGLCETPDGARRYFSMMAGVGFDAHVVAGIDPALTRRFGKGAYVWQTLKEWLALQPARYTLGDGRDASSLILANGHFYAGRFTVAPEANLDDPALIAARFTKGGRLATALYAAALPFGLLPHLPSVKRERITRVSVDGPAGEPVQADGDTIATLPVTFTLASERLTIFAAPRARA